MMRLITCFLSVVTIGLMAVAAAAGAADATGTWSGTIGWNDENHTGPAHMVLKQEGNKVTGTAGPNAEQQFAITNGKMANGRLTFELTDKGMKFELKQEGDEISGKVVRDPEGENRTGSLNLKRQP